LSLIALGVPATFVSAITVLILVILAIALQQSVADLAASVAFLVFQPFKRGELVETMGQMREVHEILVFNTVLLLPDQRLVSLPNSKIQAIGVVNYTRMGRVRVTFTVPYDEDLDRVRGGDRDCVERRPHPSFPPFQVVTEDLAEIGVRLGDSGETFGRRGGRCPVLRWLIAQDGCLSAAVRVRQLRSRPICPAPMSASSSGDDRNDVAVENYDRVQDDLVEARTRLARAIAGAAMSGMTQAEIVDLTGYPADLVLRICRDAGISGD
jgi:hypothetical protein